MASVWGGVRSIDRGGGSLVGLWAAESQCTEEAGWEEEDRGGILKGGHGDSVVTSHVHTLQSSLVLCVHTGVFSPPPISSQKLLFSLGGSFLYYADHFKLYSGFCANHIKVQKVLERGTTHILIFCIVTRNSMQKQTNPPPLNLASVLLCCVRGSSAAHGWRFGLLFWEANQLCMKVNVPEWDGGWKRGERCLSSLAPVPLQLQHHARRSTRLSTFQFVIDTFKALSPFSPQTDDV